MCSLTCLYLVLFWGELGQDIEIASVGRFVVLMLMRSWSKLKLDKLSVPELEGGVGEERKSWQ